MIKLGSKGTGVISALEPTTNRILKIFDPMMFPIAISALPFLAAVTEVTSSGKDVPKATMVSPINLWLTPSEMAMVVAASTAKLLPIIKHTSPSGINKGLVFLISASSV